RNRIGGAARRIAFEPTIKPRGIPCCGQPQFRRNLLNIWQGTENRGECEVMTSVARKVGLGLLLLASAQVSASAAVQNPAPRPTPEPVRAAVVRPASPAPHYIRDRVEDLGKAFNGRVGIAVRSVDDNWATGWKADELYPQHSASKLCGA